MSTMSEKNKRRCELWEILKSRGAIKGDHYLYTVEQLEEVVKRTEGMTPKMTPKKLVSVKPEPKVSKPKEKKPKVKKPVQPELPKEPPKPTLRDIAMKDPLCIQLQEELIGAVGDEEKTKEIRARAAARFAELKKEHNL